MRNLTRVAAAVVIVAGAVTTLLWSWNALRPSGGGSAASKPPAGFHTVTEDVGMLRGRFRVANNPPKGQPPPPVASNRPAAQPPEAPQVSAERASPVPPPKAPSAPQPPVVATNKPAPPPAEASPPAERRSTASVTPPSSAAQEPAPQAVAPTAPMPSSRETYKITSGDTLSGIAGKVLGDPRRWRDIAALNPGLEARRLRPGQVIRMPSQPDAGASHESATGQKPGSAF